MKFVTLSGFKWLTFGAIASSAFVFATMPSSVAQQGVCPGNPDALGVGRTVEIDTTGGPGFGMEHYKAHDFLQMKEVILTFDDGPHKFHTDSILAALGQHCTKAIFFSIGKNALDFPHIIRKVAAAGHTVGTHTWSHADLRNKAKDKAGVDEIERGVSAVRRAVGGPISPFFRYPFLLDSKETVAHLQGRNVAMWSTDIDSFDFKLRSPEAMVKSVMDKLDKKGKGIILMHDVQGVTAKAAPLLLTELKAKGYKIVHVKAKGELKTLAEYDSMIEKDTKGLGASNERPTAMIVKTVEEPKAATPAAAVPVKK